jgi:predicted hydrocarbon binding protein
MFSFGGKRGISAIILKDEQEDLMAQKGKFIHDWILSLMENMDRRLDDDEKISLLEACGRACAGRHAKAEALKHKGDLEGWLGLFKKWVGPGNVRREDNAVHLTYIKCLCPLVQDLPPLMSKTFCNCSRGWLKEVFETVVEKPVEVKLEDSIMQGGKQCRFLVSF